MVILCNFVLMMVVILFRVIDDLVMLVEKSIFCWLLGVGWRVDWFFLGFWELCSMIL